MEADVGSVVSLNCEVDSNPQPEIVWIQHPSDRVVGTSSNLTFSVSNETAGRYYCKANVPGYAEISADAYVYLKGSPSISSPRTQYGLVGDTSRIECFAASVPRARHVSWTFNGQEISSESGHDYSILVDAVPGGVKSTLIIRDSQSHHYGKYNCTVVNDYGNDVAEILLQAKGEYQNGSEVERKRCLTNPACCALFGPILFSLQKACRCSLAWWAAALPSPY